VFGLEWLRVRTDTRGLLEHARGGLPLLEEGYTTDDNARALLYLALLPPGARDPALVRTYLAFLLYMQRQDGRFRNSLSPEGRFEDEGEAEDPTGRAILALAAASLGLDPDLRETARFALERALGAAERLCAPRAQAYALLGLLALREESFRELAHLLGRRLRQAFAQAEASWPFPGPLTYANYRPLEALWAYARAFGDREALGLVRRAQGLLDRVYFSGEGASFFDPVGNAFMSPGEAKPLFDQQPIEAKAAVSFYLRVGERPKAELAFLWFHGRNRLGVPLVDAFGPMDGLTPQGPNRNRGAEALLSYLLAWQALVQGPFPREEAP
jgi:hypothetical protein